MNELERVAAEIELFERGSAPLGRKAAFDLEIARFEPVPHEQVEDGHSDDWQNKAEHDHAHHDDSRVKVPRQIVEAA